MSSKRVYYVSLGCPKNRVDTEVMLGGTMSAGHEVVTDPAVADVIVVNTCGFIGEAKEESVDTILEMAKYKTDGSCKKLIVTGCLSQRYPKELADEIPEIDRIFGSGGALKVTRALDLDEGDGEKIDVEPEPNYLYDARTERVLAGPSYSAYVKIAEGCDRPCAFCIIPKLRGPQRSRTVDDVVSEVQDLVGRGAREVNLIAQDLTKYGDDLTGEQPNLAGLLRRVARVPGVRWVRLHYAYPSAVTDELIDVIATEPAVAKYLDVPIQHIDDGVLKLMRRGYTSKVVYKMIEKLRARIPEIVLRTTVLVGHPGETDEAFAALQQLVEVARFDRLGAFTFSSEEGTVSHELGAIVPKKVAEKRRTALMRAQRKISKQKQQALVGRELEVLVEGVSTESEYLLQGRWAGQAPEIDGVVYLADGEAQPGDLVRARVTNFADYDLAASILAVSQAAAPSSSKRRLNVIS